VMENYELICKIGEGTFGEVFKAKHLETGTVVALKKIRIHRAEDGISKNLLREIKALEHIESANVIQLFEFFPHGSAIVLVCEFMESDLYAVMRAAADCCRELSLAEIKAIMKMLLAGLTAVHESQIIHRDLKPSNILFSPEGRLKLADFGLARIHQTNQEHDYSPEVVTRWYRAPELLFGARQYGNEVDLWAAGCIMAELFTHYPVFPGENDIDQLYRVLRVLGTPDVDSWPEVKSLPDFNKIVFPIMPKLPLDSVLPDIPLEALDLISRFLVLQPSRRITARQALQHQFFSSEPLPVHPSKLCRLVQLPKRTQKMRSAEKFREDLSAPLDLKSLGILRGHARTRK